MFNKTIIQFYVPTTEAEEEEVNDFYDQVQLKFIEHANMTYF